MKSDIGNSKIGRKTNKVYWRGTNGIQSTIALSNGNEIETRWLIEKGSLGQGGREGGSKSEREREAACTFDWKNSSNQEASRLSIPKDRGSHVRARARACEYERASVEYRAEKGAPPLSLSLSLSLVSRPVRGAAALLLLLRFSPYGPHRSSHALSPLPRIPPVITPLLRRATKMAAPPVHPTVPPLPSPFLA